MTVNLLLGDSIELLQDMAHHAYKWMVWNHDTAEPATFDLIVFDPDHEMPDKLKCLDNCWSISKHNSTLLFFGKNHKTIIRLLGDSCWKVRQLVDIYKDGEQIGVVAVATDTEETRLDHPDLERLDVDTKGADGHPTSKDASWLDPFLDTGRYESVLDPFMGSAQWGVACQKRSIDYTGIEIDPEYFRMAEENLGVRS